MSVPIQSTQSLTRKERLGQKTCRINKRKPVCLDQITVPNRARRSRSSIGRFDLEMPRSFSGKIKMRTPLVALGAEERA